VTVAGPGALSLEPYGELIADELNVKEVQLVSEVGEVADHVLQVNPSTLGPRLGSATQQVIRAVREGAWTRTPEGDVEVAGHVLGKEDYFLSLVPKDPEASRALPGNDLVVSLSLEVTPELAREGLARDIVRQVQEARKTAGLDVSDHIRLVLYFPPHEPELRHAAERHRDLIAGETLSDEVVFADGPIVDSFRATVADGRAFHIGIVKLPKGR
jgi:isoleucyl-tRNA synthetase